MNQLNTVWKQRLSGLIKEVGKYSRIIFNDHFSVILLFLIGFGAFYYRNSLEQLLQLPKHTLEIPIKLGTLFALTIFFPLGRPIWLTKDTDKSYLFPRGKEWVTFWLKGVFLGVALPVIFLILTITLLFPFMNLISNWGMRELCGLIFLSSLYKVISFLYIFLSHFIPGTSKREDLLGHRGLHSLIYASMLASIFFLSGPLDGIIVIVVTLGLIAYGIFRFSLIDHSYYQFETIVKEEQLREALFYKILALFAEVPGKTPVFKKQSYFNQLLKLGDKYFDDRYSFLYWRLLLRNEAYSGVWLRVSFFIAFLMLLSRNPILICGLGVAGQVLILIQLLPLIFHYQSHVFQQIYSKNKHNQVQAFQRTTSIIFLIQIILFSIFLLFKIGITIELFMIMASWLFSAVILLMIYVPYRMKARNKIRNHY